MISGPAAEAARLARLVAWIGDRAWGEELAVLADTTDAPAPAEGAATHGDIARAGTALVAGLAGQGRWDDAAAQARRLRAYFFATGMELGPIAPQAFDGLLAASLARDPEELADFVDLVAEMFG